MGKHTNAKHDDETWLALFRRWHGREATAAALRAEAGVSMDTWSANAARLGMRICDLPPDHPGRRRTPVFAERAADYRHPNSLLTEGQWRALFALRTEGVPDTVLSVRFGVHAATICSQAAARGIKRADVRAAADAALAAAVEAGSGDADRAPSTATRSDRPVGDADRSSTPNGGGLGVRVDPTDWAATRRAFEAVIVEAAARGDYVSAELRARAKMQVEKAIFPGGYRPSGYLSPQTPGDGQLSDDAYAAEEPARPEPVLRDAQRPPEGGWTTWLFLGGRGAGKTLAGAMWLSDQAEALGPGGRLALIGPTLHDVREVMIEGASGILSLARWRGRERPVFEPSRRRLVFPNQAVAQVFSAEDPDSLRGPQFSAAWADEMCAWRGAGETLALLRMGLRLPGAPSAVATARLAEPRCLSDERDGAQAASDRVASGSPPRLCVTTTPRATQALRALRAEPGLVETHAGTRDNAEHLAPGFVEGLERLYGGTRRAAQEIEGRVVEVEGALWTAETLAGCREGVGDTAFDRVVVALDPTTTAGGNACGIVAAGRCGEAAWVLADRSVAGVGPLEWARRAAALAEELGAAAIVAEVNQGGDMVRTVLKAAGCSVPVKEVRATRGKRVRAEPVAALYEQGRVRHVAGLGRLEEELMAFGGDEGGCDFDRADALVWAITDLLIDRTADGARGPRMRSLAWEARGGGISQPLNLGIAGRGRGW